MRNGATSKSRHQSLSLEGLTFSVGNSWISLSYVGFHSVQPLGSSIASSMASKFTRKHCGGWKRRMIDGWLCSSVSVAAPSTVDSLWWAITCGAKTFTTYAHVILPPQTSRTLVFQSFLVSLLASPNSPLPMILCMFQSQDSFFSTQRDH